MPSKSPRTFDPALATGLPDEARKAVKIAFDAMSTWRTQIVNNEKNIEAVIDKVAAGAKALGWPEEIVDATRAQMETMNEMQLQLMDQRCLGAANQIAEPVVGDAIEAEVLVSLHPDGQLAGGGHLANESIRALHAGRATVAKGMDERDGALDETLANADR